ncbi:MAG: DUF2058 domain-containing protein [Myxococcales bacterium]|jgi:uncharacterized protein YaiL (DUF2058 family)|nr:DUF2058 domain-containing protein [Myxococcales bacterium]
MQSLKDKLVQAGVISADRVAGESEEQRSRRLNKEMAERRAQIKALIAPAAIETTIGEHVFFFTTRSKKMRRLVIEEDVKLGLEEGRLAVVEFPDKPDFPWAVVPRAIAEKALKIDPVAVRFYVRSQGEILGAVAD